MTMEQKLRASLMLALRNDLVQRLEGRSAMMMLFVQRTLDDLDPDMPGSLLDRADVEVADIVARYGLCLLDLGAL